jgi:hypothetical protein
LPVATVECTDCGDDAERSQSGLEVRVAIDDKKGELPSGAATEFDDATSRGTCASSHN